jgi:hypothetical protein
MQHQNHLKAMISSFKRVMKPSTLMVARSALSLTLTQICSTQGIQVKLQGIKSILRASISEGDTGTQVHTRHVEEKNGTEVKRTYISSLGLLCTYDKNVVELG